MKPRVAKERLIFRYIPGFISLVTALAIFILYYGLLALLWDVMKFGDMPSPKTILVIVLGIAGNLLLWSAVVKLWQLNWRFTFTPTHLIAVHLLRRERVEIPWATITRVSKLPRAWWARGGGGLGVSQIETADGRKIPFMTHLMLRYSRFLNELKARATSCQSFDPYWSEWER
jgi:hypothetical protein